MAIRGGVKPRDICHPVHLMRLLTNDKCITFCLSLLMNNACLLSAAGDGRGTAELELVRRKLQSHLESSACYDVSLLLTRLASSQLWQEQVILHAKASASCLRLCLPPCIALCFELSQLEVNSSCDCNFAVLQSAHTIHTSLLVEPRYEFYAVNN